MKETIEYILFIFISCLLLTQIIFACHYYERFFNEYFHGKKVSWNSKYDRLVLLSSIVFLFISVFLFYELLKENPYSIVIIYTVTIGIVTLLNVLIFYNAQKERNRKSSLSSKKIVIEEKNDFKLNFTKNELKQIYQRLIDNSFIEILVENKEMTDDDYFVHILFSGVLPPKPIFKLDFDHVQTKPFLIYLNSGLGKRDKFRLTIEKFAKIFENKNGKILVGSYNTSTSKSNEPKKIELINSLFHIEKKG
ncbi:hypothetical protein [Elizabethkingia ursingii]